MKNYAALIALILSFALTACGSDEAVKAPLKGDRLSIMELQKTLEPDAANLQTAEVTVPNPWSNEFWPQAGGYPNHAMQNPSLAGTVKREWSADIGDGATKRFPLTASPIVVDGQIFTLDIDFSLRAFDTKTGKENWRTSIKSQFEKDPVISGGIAFGEGLIFATNGYNEVLAVKPDDGKIVWRQLIPTPSRAAPTVMNGRVFVTTLDNRLIVLSTADGSSQWEYTGITETAGLVGAASPAANNEIVVPVFTSGELTALRVQNGSVAWSDNLSSLQRFGGTSSISDIKALPVLDRGLVFAISFGGRLVAIDQRSGARVWQRDIAGANTPWIAGNHIFVLSADNELVALSREKGIIRWVTALPKYENMEKKKGLIVWAGPVMAGGRLIATATNGMVREIDPATGETINTWNSKLPLSMPPIIAAGTMYLLSDDGKLLAYR